MLMAIMLRRHKRSWGVRSTVRVDADQAGALHPMESRSAGTGPRSILAIAGWPRLRPAGTSAAKPALIFEKVQHYT